jgi:hypothetical protein
MILVRDGVIYLLNAVVSHLFIFFELLNVLFGLFVKLIIICVLVASEMFFGLLLICSLMVLSFNLGDEVLVVLHCAALK